MSGISITVLTDSSSGTLNVFGWNGTPQNPKQLGESFQRMGGSGSELNLTGTKAPISTSTCYGFATDAAGADTIKSFIEGLENSYIGITLASGESFPSCLCSTVEVQRRAGIHNIAGTTYLFRLEIRLVYEVQP